MDPSLGALPSLNAALNVAAAICLLLGWSFIRRGRVEAHRRAMWSALCCSTVFLISYLIYHFQVGSVRFQGQGPVRTLYFAILLTHTVLAAAVPPLALVTLSRALARRFDRHRAIARWTLPIWLYVSVTGVAVYWMLYQMDF